MAEIAALVVTHLGGARLGRCLAALRAQQPAVDAILVVVSNPVRPPLPELGGARLLHPGRALHYGEAVNLGARTLDCDALLVLNDDTVARPGFMGALLAAHAGWPDALLQPRILLAGAPDRLDNAGHRLFFDGHNQARGRARPNGPAFDHPGEVGVVSGAAFVAPRRLFEERGGFDISLGPFGDDLDLSLRWVRAGGELRYVPDALIEHELGASYGRAGLRKIYLVERNRLRAGLRSLPLTALAGAPWTTPLRWGLMAGAAAAGCGWGDQLPAGASLAALAGVLGGVAHAPTALAKRWRDAPRWRRGEREMLRHLWQHRARIGDFL
jgi:N-acetylglucosaminyl-diphospho-decaprenol L-rhamnosyltransferase